MRLDKQNCGECGHFDPEGAPSARTGFCWRFPPVATPLLVPAQNAVTREPGMQVQNHTVWPIVDQKSGCGEYKTRILLS